MKKSKIIVPALGLLLLSTAASVSGTVAWFTANRVYGFTAGEFAVVNTKDNLSCQLGAGFGTAVDNETNAVSVTGGKILTDASLDHTDTTVPIIIPDGEGKKVGAKVELADIADQDARATDTYSAFSWTATFSIAFGGTATEDVGLFFDFADDDSYANSFVKVGSKLPDGTVLRVGDDVTSYYTDPKCTTSATGTAVADTKYYMPVSGQYQTARGYRVAMIPTSIPTNSLGITKIWAPNQTSANAKFIDGLAEGADLGAGTAYSTSTVQNSGSGLTAGTVTTNPVVMGSDNSSLTVPTSATTKAQALAMKNYLGFFKATPDSTIELTFTFVAWYEGTDPTIVNNSHTIYDTVAIGMQFGVYNLSA